MRTISAAVLPIVLGALLLSAGGCSNEPTSATTLPFSNYPVTLVPTAVVNKSAIKVMVPDGSGGWKDVTADAGAPACSDTFDEVGSDITDGTALSIRMTSASDFEFLDTSGAPIGVSGTVYRNGNNFMFTYSLAGQQKLYGVAADSSMLVGNIAICSVTDDGSSRSEVGTTMPIDSLGMDVTTLPEFTGDTVSYQVYEYRLDEQ